MSCEWIKEGEWIEHCSCCGLRLRNPLHPIRHTCNANGDRFYSDELRRVKFPQRLANFVKALAAHIAAGMPTVSQEVIDARLEHCKVCKLFTGEVCTHEKCGCNVGDKQKFLNKLAWADQECPIGKWGKV